VTIVQGKDHVLATRGSQCRAARVSRAVAGLACLREKYLLVYQWVAFPEA
jgi:hypothetical protein